MAGRDVNLNIKVSGEQDVRRAEASIARLKATAASTTDYGVRQTRPGMAANEEERQRRAAAFMSREVPQAAKQAETAVQAVTTATTSSSNAFGVLAAGGAAVAAAITAIVAVFVVLAAGAISLAAAITKVTKAFADYAIEIGNIAEQTGLAVETVAALRHEAEAQGRSWSTVESAAASFRKTIGEASAGSKEAITSLKTLGIDGQAAAYDVDSAFKQAIATIVKAPNEVEQARLAFAAFGDDGAKLLPFLREFQGDVDGAIRKAEELGIVVGQNNVAAAREFNRNYEDAKKVLLGLTYTFGNEFLPVVTDVLSRFSGWLRENQGDVRGLAEATGLMVDDAINQFTRLKNWIYSNESMFSYLDYLPGYAIAKYVGRGIGEHYGGRVAQSPLAARMGGQAMTMDDGVLGAKFSFTPKKEKETEAEKQAKFLRELLGQLNRELEYFGDKSKVAAVSQQLLARGIDIVNNSVAKQILNIAGLIDQKQKDADAEKKRLEEQKKYKELMERTTAEIDNASINERISIAANIAELQQRIAKGRELNVVEKARVDLVAKLAQAETTGLPGVKAKDREGLIAKMRVEGEETIKRLERVLELLNQIDAIEKAKARDKAFQEYSQSLEDQFDAVRRGNEPLTVYEQTMRDLSRDYKDLAPEQKQHLLDLASQIDLVTDLNRQHAELKAFFQEGLRYVFDGDFKGLFENWGDRIKDNLADKLSDIFATHFLGYDPKKTNNPVARPIVDKLDETNNILKTIAFSGGGGAGAAAGAGGGGIFSRILGAFGIGGGSVPGGTPNFNPNAGSSSGGALSNGDVMNWVTGGSLGGGSGSSGGGSLLGQLSQLFSTGSGGIFAPQKNLLNGKMSGAAGIMSGIGQLATIAGGFIGGRLGGVISMAGTGASIGAMFGPWGAAIGAGIGALIGLFTGNSARRRDERTRNQGMLDAQAEIKKQFDALATQVRFGQIDPASAIIRGTAIGDQVRSQYLQMANSLQDSKTRRIAVADVSRVDSLIAQRMAELRGLTEIAQGSADRMKRILPEFAGGHYFRPNGLLPGVFDGSDNILAMISRGEMVLNPAQINKVRRQAGFDVFAGAGIPNYPKANPSSHLATGGIVGGMGLAASAPQVMMQPNLTVVVEGATFDAKTRAYLMSDDGSKTFVNVYKKKKESGDIR